MRAFLAVIAIIIFVHAVPAIVMAIVPAWILQTLFITLLIGVPVGAFIAVAIWTQRQIKEGN